MRTVLQSITWRALAARTLWLAVVLALIAPPAVPATHAQLANAQPARPFASVVDCLRAGVNLGLSPETSPRFAASCYGTRWADGGYTAPGNPAQGDAAATDPAILTFGDGQPNVAGVEPGHAGEATLAQVGSVYGLAYSSGANPGAPSSARGQRLFAAAFVKRLTRFGPGGPGAIYVRDSATGALRLFAAVPGVVPGPATPFGHSAGGVTIGYAPGDGSNPTFPNGVGYVPEMGGLHQAGASSITVPWVGKSGLGDLDLDAQERYLYTVNLRDKRVYRFDTWSADPQASLYRLPPLPAFATPRPCDSVGGADLRPFALHLTHDSLYLGFTCAGEETGARVLAVQRYDLSAGGWDADYALVMHLADYAAQRGSWSGLSLGWRSWTPAAPPVNTFVTPYPQAMLADLAIDESGALILGIRDRLGDMGATQLVADQAGRSFGDTLRALPTGPHTWAAPNPGAEHFADDDPATHAERTWGGLAYLPGRRDGGFGGEIATTMLTPYRLNSGGVAFYDAGTSGGARGFEELYAAQVRPGTFAKTDGLGDLELLCAWGALGDRVWRDADGDGIQESGEPGLDGVSLQLFAAHDAAFSAPLATVTTGDLDGDGVGGEYRFYVAPFAGYQVRLDPANFAPGGSLAGLVVSPRDRAADDVDSDADQLTRALVTAPLAREQVDRSRDIGVMDPRLAIGEVGDRVWLDANRDGVQSSGEVSLSGVPVRLLACRELVPTPGCRDYGPFSYPGGSAAESTSTLVGYRFDRLPPNYYQVEFVPPPGYDAAPRDRAADDVDSDADAASAWRTPGFPVVAGTRDATRDLGLAPASTNLRVSLAGPPVVYLTSTARYTVGYVNVGQAAGDARLTLTLPAALTLQDAAGAPSIAGQTLTWHLGTLASGASGSFVVDAAAAAMGSHQIQAAVSSATPDDVPEDNTATATTLVGRPNLSVTKTGPSLVGPLQTFVYQIEVRNVAGAGGQAGLLDAQDVVLEDELPPEVALLHATPGYVADGARLRWSLGTLPAGAARSFEVAVEVRPSAPGPIDNHASVRTASPGDEAGDNHATATTAIGRPDVYVDIEGPVQAGEGSRISYSLAFGNRGLVPAEGSQLRVELPPGVVAQVVVPGAGDALGRTLVWPLGTLAPGETGQATIEALVEPGAAAALTALAEVSSTTPEENPAGNQDATTTHVVPVPPPPPVAHDAQLRLAIHSDLDPRSADSSPDNAVYRSAGTSVTWPLGEVLDLTPRAQLSVPALGEPQRSYYEYRTRVTGWRLIGFSADGSRWSAVAGDDFGRSGCRRGASPVGGGCAYSYIGGTRADDPLEPNEAQMASQAHVFWAVGRPLAMRDDVYVLAVGGPQRVQVQVEVGVLVEVISRETGMLLRSEAQLREQEFGVRLIAPRTLQ